MKTNNLCIHCKYYHPVDIYNGECLNYDSTLYEMNIQYGCLTKLRIVPGYHLCSKFEEDNNMLKSEEIQNEIEKTQKQLAELQKALKEAEEKERGIPDSLEFEEKEKIWKVCYDGDIVHSYFNTFLYDEEMGKHNHRLFKTKEYAELFYNKTQFIADCLHFKYLYDRDYKPDWNLRWISKYFIVYDHDEKCYIVMRNMTDETIETVYFSSNEIAQKCADWLNEKNGYDKYKK